MVGQMMEHEQAVRVPPKPPMPKVERQRRMGRCGELFVDRRLVGESLPEELEWRFVPKLASVGMAGLEGGQRGRFRYGSGAQEALLQPMQDQLFGDYYVFSDTEESLVDLETRYQVYGAEFKKFLRSKKKTNPDRTSGSLPDP